MLTLGDNQQLAATGTQGPPVGPLPLVYAADIAYSNKTAAALCAPNSLDASALNGTSIVVRLNQTVLQGPITPGGGGGPWGSCWMPVLEHWLWAGACWGFRSWGLSRGLFPAQLAGCKCAEWVEHSGKLEPSHSAAMLYMALLRQA